MSPQKPVIVYILLILSLLFSPTVSADTSINITKTKARIRTDYELVKVSDSEDMGMLGIHYDFFPIKQYQQIYFGVGSLGAVHGDRGGFFTGGLSAGWLQNFHKKHYVDIGAHIAGGGGAEAFPGSGMLFRSHLGYEYQVNDSAIRIGVANTRFIDTTNPNSNDIHPYIGLTLSADFINSFLSTESVFENNGFKLSRYDIAPAVMTYSPKDNISLRSGKPHNETGVLLGMQWNKFSSKNNFYSSVGFYGAGSGGIDGYATVLAGVGWRHKLTRRIYLDAKGLVGLGGGGDVDTGGGLYYQPMIGGGIILSRDWSVDLLAGQTLADDGGFEANTLMFALNWTPNVLNPNSANTSFGLSKFESVKWRAFVDHKTYLPDSGIYDKSGAEYASSINLLGFGVEKPITDWMAISGRGYGAWSGGVGAYAEGLFGVQLHTGDMLSQYNTQIEVRYDIGVAGGGGMEVGDGVINQLIIGAKYAISDTLSLRAELGRMQAIDGTFAADTMIIGVDWEFGLPVKR